MHILLGLRAIEPRDPTTLGRYLERGSPAAHSFELGRMHLDDPDEKHYETVTSIVMDLHAGSMWITDGPPCNGEYHLLRLVDTRYRAAR